MRKTQAERIARLIRRVYSPLRAEVISLLGRSIYAVVVKNLEGWEQIVYSPYRRDRVKLAKMLPPKRKKAKR